MKILHVINNLGSGGAEKLLTDILPIMKKRGHSVCVAISNNKANVSRFEEYLKNNRIPILDFNASFYNPIQVIKLIKLINKEKFDIVHAHLFPTQYWLAFASYFINKNTKLIKTEHSVFNERKNYYILKPLEKIVYSSYSRIIAITSEVKLNLAKWLGKEKNIVIVNNGVNLNQISSQIKKVTPLLFKGDKFNILMVARFDYSQKDQESLVRAITFINKDINVFFAGEGPNQKNIIELAKKLNILDNIIFLGLRDDIYNLMNKVDLNVLSTNHEGLSGVVLESLASGKPFIGSDVVGVKEIVPDKTFLFPRNNPKTLALKINSIMDNKELQNMMIKKSLIHVKKYDTPIMVDKYLQTYELALNA